MSEIVIVRKCWKKTQREDKGNESKGETALAPRPVLTLGSLQLTLPFSLTAAEKCLI